MHGCFRIVHFHEGKEDWRREAHNITHNEGEEMLLKTIFSKELSCPMFYMGLDNRVTLAETDTLSGIMSSYELAASNNYSRVTVSGASGDWTTSTNASGDWFAKTVTCAFSATTGAWLSAVNVFLATDASNDGYVVGSLALTSQVVLQANDYYKLDYTFTLKET